MSGRWKKCDDGEWIFGASDNEDDNQKDDNNNDNNQETIHSEKVSKYFFLIFEVNLNY